jgi:hypothetical protein
MTVSRRVELILLPCRRPSLLKFQVDSLPEGPTKWLGGQDERCWLARRATRWAKRFALA